MRDFFKNNLISIIACSLTVAAVAFADAYNRPYTSADYAGGTKAVGAKVNEEFQDLTDWLNGGNISSQNIAALGVATSNIASGAVTPPKMGAANIKITSSSSLFETASGTPMQITNLSTTITTYGRPVEVRLQAANTPFFISGTSTTRGYLYSDDDGVQTAYLLFVRDSSTINRQSINYTATDLNYGQCSAYSYIEEVAAGTYTYKASVQSNGVITAQVAGCQLVVREL